MTTGHRYRAFALDFQRWHYRMTPDGSERASAPAFLSMLQAVNLVGLSLWIPTHQAGAIIAACFACGLALYRVNRRVFAGLDLPARYARWSDRVPGLREFPYVYGYLLFTVAMLVVAAWVRL